MPNIVVKVENLGKKYQLGTIGYGSLRHDLQAWFARIRGKEDPNARIGEQSRLDLHGDFWALQDMSFEIEYGDRVGIIGKNGAGKSTLLKILSQITRPTTGVVRMKGRIASLLEVGTGFHGELTGRENIFLNGAVMGMKRQEIQRKFDEIVAFSGVEQFIDTPVKRYSSGMYVRLGFAVAAHLDPDILIVDEVLAVGDAEFQKKSLGKMESAAREGRTVIFVSHNMQSIRFLCREVLWLDHGTIVKKGEAARIVDEYLDAMEPDHEAPIMGRTDREGTGRLRFSSVVVDETKLEQRKLSIDLHIKNHAGIPMNNALVSVVFEDSSGRAIANLVNYNIGQTQSIGAGEGHVRLVVEKLNLVSGRYYVSVFVSSDQQNTEIFDWVRQAASFIMPDYDYYGTGQLPIMKGSSLLYLDYTFENSLPPTDVRK